MRARLIAAGTGTSPGRPARIGGSHYCVSLGRGGGQASAGVGSTSGRRFRRLQTIALEDPRELQEQSKSPAPYGPVKALMLLLST